MDAFKWNNRRHTVHLNAKVPLLKSLRQYLGWRGWLRSVLETLRELFRSVLETLLELLEDSALASWLSVDMVSLPVLLPTDRSKLPVTSWYTKLQDKNCFLWMYFTSMTGILSLLPGQSPSFVHNLLASFRSCNVILYLTQTIRC